ncbi:MAG: hypothetical protein QOJ99_110 [Bryobacterales bacterium]|nr:hypothetical protein [Bryobacterales bacterium]
MTSTDKAREPRGSQKMLEQLSKNGATPSSEEVLKALDLPAGVKVQNWHTRGIPPAFLHMETTLQTPISQLGAVVDRLVKLNDSAINLKVLINGIPFPDIAQVIVRNTPGER